MQAILDHFDAGYYVLDFVLHDGAWCAWMRNIHPYSYASGMPCVEIYVPIPGEFSNADEAAYAMVRAIGYKIPGGRPS
jgi:hypothetical protein